MILDLSHWNSDSDPLTAGELRAAGVSAVWAKATEGASFTDRQFRHHRSICAAAGIPFGAYLFARPGVSADAQLDRFARVAGDVGLGELPPMLDFEATTQGDQSPLALELLEGMEARTGRRPLFYSYVPWIRAHIGPRAGTAVGRFPLWLARYPSNAVDPDPAGLKAPTAPWPWSAWTLWQYTSKGTIAGHRGHLDKNLPAAADTIATLIAAAGGPDPEEDFMAKLTDDEQQELLAKTRDIHAELFDSVPSQLDEEGHETKAGTLRWRITTLMTRTSDLVTGRRPGK